MQQALVAWLPQVKDHVDAIVEATDAVHQAAQAENVSSMHAACQQYHDGVAGLQRHMPPPDLEFEVKLQAALSDYDVAMHFCLEGIGDMDPAELSHTVQFLASGNQSMRDATAILDRDMGGTGITFG